MSALETAGFLSPNRIFELVWYSENKEAGASSQASVISAIEFYAFLDNCWNIFVLVTLPLTD